MIEEILKKSYIVDTKLLAENINTTTRLIRKAIGKLMSKREVLFIPVRDKKRPGLYKRAELMEIEDVRAYYREMRAHVKSVYFDRMLPIAEYLDVEEKKVLYAHLDLFMDEERNLNNGSHLL